MCCNGLKKPRGITQGNNATDFTFLPFLALFVPFFFFFLFFFFFFFCSFSFLFLFFFFSCSTRTRLPCIVAFNKVDIVSCDFALEWMKDADSFRDAIEQETSYMGTLVQSMGLALEEFYENLTTVGVSAHTGAGIDQFFAAVDAAVDEYYTEFLPVIQVLIINKKEEEEKEEEKKKKKKEGEEEEEKRRRRREREEEGGGGGERSAACMYIGAFDAFV